LQAVVDVVADAGKVTRLAHGYEKPYARIVGRHAERERFAHDLAAAHGVAAGWRLGRGNAHAHAAIVLGSRVEITAA
jgi:hypothetical protein